MMRILLWAATIFVAGIIGLSPAFLVVLYREAPPVSYGRRQVLTEQVPPGGTLKIRISADITKNCDALVHRTIVDANGTLFELAPEPRSLQTDYIVQVPIPLGTMPGPAYYSARIVWSCNFVQRYFPKEVIQRNLEFTIVPAEGQLPLPEQQGIYQVPLVKSEIARAQP